MKKIRVIGLICFLMVSLKVHAQHDWNWTFGDSILLKFENGQNPVVDTGKIHAWFLEMGASYSNANGNMELFMNHKYIYDSTALPLLPGLASNNTSISSYTQGGLILPFPNRIYCFYLQSVQASAGLSVDIVEKSLTNPGEWAILKDSVIFSTPSAGTSYSEKMSAVRHSNGKDWWLLLHGQITNGEYFYKYLVTENHISGHFPQIIGSDYGVWSSGGGLGEIGEMCFSPDGKKLIAVTYSGYIDLFDFDRCTGELSNFIPLDTLEPVFSGNKSYYGCEFSSDASKLYVSISYSSFPGIIQFDLADPDIPNSKTQVFQMNAGFDSAGTHGMQRGPDGKIYVTTPSLYSGDNDNPQEQFLSVIELPNQKGIACDFQYKAIDLFGRRSRLGLPNLPNYNLGPERMIADAGPDLVICEGDSIQIGVPDTSGGRVNYFWKPLRTSDHHVKDSTAAQPYVSPGDTTIFILTVTDSTWNCPCSTSTDTVKVYVIPASEFPVAQVLGDTVICSGETVNFWSGVNNTSWQYLWRNSAGESIGSGTGITANPSFSGFYTLSLTHSNGMACTEREDSGFVTVETPVAAPVLSDVSGCPNDTVFVGSSPLPNLVYAWQPSVGLLNTSASQSGYVVQVAGLVSLTLTVTDTTLQSSCKTRSGGMQVNVECENEILVFPNPSQDKFSIHVSSETASTLELELFNAIGQKIWTGEYETAQVFEVELNMERLATGVYFLRGKVGEWGFERKVETIRK